MPRRYWPKGDRQLSRGERDKLPSVQVGPDQSNGQPMSLRYDNISDAHVEHNALLIHGAPQMVLHSLDPDEHFVEVPFVSWPGPAAAQTAGKCLAELLAPAPDRLIGSDNASFSQEQLDIPQAEVEHVIQPDGLADDLGGKAMAVMRVGRWLHAVSLLGLQSARQTRLT